MRTTSHRPVRIFCSTRGNREYEPPPTPPHPTPPHILLTFLKLDMATLKYFTTISFFVIPGYLPVPVYPMRGYRQFAMCTEISQLCFVVDPDPKLYVRIRNNHFR